MEGIPKGFKICAGVSRLNSCRLTVEHPKRIIIWKITSKKQREKYINNIPKKIIFENTYGAILKLAFAAGKSTLNLLVQNDFIKLF
jgi:hypothetical protein